MAVDDGDCVVQVVSAFSAESLCSLKLPGSGTVLDVKRSLQATLGVNVFCQRLIVSPEGRQAEDRKARQAEDHEVLATLPGLRLQLVRLEYADHSEDEVEHLLRAAGEGMAPEVEQLLRRPLQPDCTLKRYSGVSRGQREHKGS